MVKKDRVSIKDVSALAGVSAATVSNVFSGRKPVNRDLQIRVRDAASTLGYHPDRAASQLRSGRTNVVAVLVPDLTDTFFATMVTRIEALAQSAGYEVIVASSRDNPVTEASRLEALLAWRLAGVVAVPCTNDLPSALINEADSTPIVLVDRVALPCPTVDTVTIDNVDAGQVAARHLVEHGHRNVLLAASRMSIAPVAERMSAAADHIFRETGQRSTILELGTNVDEGAAIFGRWLERHDVPDAVLASTNVTTLSVLSAFATFRIAVPDRVSMIAFDDDAWMRARNTGLTAIRQPVEEIAEAAWARLRLRMREGVVAPPISIVLTAGLVVRSSVGRRPIVKIEGVRRNGGRATRRSTPPPAADEPIH